MTGSGQTLFATPQTARAVQRAQSLVILIGGYDGSGNFGDIALLDAASDAIDRCEEDLLVLPMLERQLLNSHRALASDSGAGHSHALFFDPGEGLEDDLVAVAVPAELSFGACYLYGGGYFNRRWGARKLAMLESAEALLENCDARRVCRLATGLQVEADWVSGLDARDRAALARFDLLGVRDRASVEALGTLASPDAVVETGDDAIGVLARLPAAADPIASEGRLLVNLHFGPHSWVSERPEALLDFYTGLVTGLSKLTNRPVLARPLIAYLDGRVDEGTAVERLTTALGALAIEVAQPLVLRPASLGTAAPKLCEASLTLSCSYHVALTSLMLGVPAVLIGDNDYYEQKAAGLREDFRLPPTFTPASSADPGAVASAIAPLLDRDGAQELNGELASAAEMLRQRRLRTEDELVGKLRRGIVTALTDQVEQQAQRLRRRAAEPAELRLQLSIAQTEREELQRRVNQSPLEGELRAQEAELSAQAAELRAQEAELRAQAAELRAQEAQAGAAEAHRTLAAVLESRSWRLLAPLRRLRAMLGGRTR